MSPKDCFAVRFFILSLIWFIFDHLDFFAAEYFTKEPQDAFIYSGNSNKISLNCQTDAAEPTYSWKRDGRFLDTTSENYKL